MITEADAEGRFTYANPTALAGSRLTVRSKELARERVGVWMHPEDAPDGRREVSRARDAAAARRAPRSARSTRRDASAGSSRSARATRTRRAGSRVVSVTRDMSQAARDRGRAARERRALPRARGSRARHDRRARRDTARSSTRTRACSNRSGYTLDELRHDGDARRGCTPTTTKPARARSARVLAHGGPTRLVHRVRRKDGHFVWVASSGARH